MRIKERHPRKPARIRNPKSHRVAKTNLDRQPIRHPTAHLHQSIDKRQHKPIDVRAGERLPLPVRLNQIKADPRFAESPLVKFGRLSVVQLTDEQYGAILETDELEAEAKRRRLTYVSLDGEIGIIGNGAGLCMGTLDLVQRAGGKAANFCDIGGGARAEVVQNAMDVIIMNPRVKGILINVFGGITRGDEVARGLVQARDNLQLKLPLVVRLSGTNQEEGREILKQNGIEPGTSAWEAAQKIVAMAQ